MRDFGLLLKSYLGDVDLAARLIESFNRLNPEGLPLFVVVPDADVPSFEHFASDTVTVLSEEPLAHYFTAEAVAGVRPGYLNQEIVKLSFWELGLVANYFCVDSDAVFVRPLSRDDFMFDADTPYTVLVEDNELKVEPRYYREHWRGREESLRLIQQTVGVVDRRILTCHGHQVFSGKVLASLKHDFLEPRGWSYLDMLAQAPYEFTWYNMWLQKSKVIPIEVREPLVKTFHHADQHLEYALRGVTADDIARGFVGVVVNSNYARSWTSGTIEEAPATTLARYATWRTLLSALGAKLKTELARKGTAGAAGNEGK